MYFVAIQAIKKSGSEIILSKNNASPAHSMLVSCGLEAGQHKDYYFRMHFADPIAQQHLSELFIKPGKELIHFLTRKYTMQALYSGIMMLFGMVNLFMFGMFRERVFIYFTLVMISFIGYFLSEIKQVDVFFKLDRFWRHYFGLI